MYTCLVFFQSPYNELRYSMIGEDSVLQYFMIDDVTGDVALKKSVQQDPDSKDTYFVSSPIIVILPRSYHKISSPSYHVRIITSPFHPIAFTS